MHRKSAKKKPVTKSVEIDPLAGSDGATKTFVPKTRKIVSNLPRGPDGKPIPGQKLSREPQSLQQAAADAFQALGGKRWLKRKAKDHPKEFMSLLARVASEEGLSGGMVYVAVPLPVEQRDLPGGALEPIEIDPLS